MSENGSTVDVVIAELLDKFAEALSQAQEKFDVPAKDKIAKIKTNTGGEYQYKYSDLDDLIKATRPALAKFGLSTLQDTHTKQGAVGVSTTILHKSGQRWTSQPVWIAVSGGKPQEIGAAITYARRYSMGAALGVASEEDSDVEIIRGGTARKVSDVPDDSKKKPAQSQQKTTSKPTAKNDPPPPSFVGVAGVKRMFGIAGVHTVSNASMKAYLASKGIHDTKKIPTTEYDTIISDIQNGRVPEVND